MPAGLLLALVAQAATAAAPDAAELQRIRNALAEPPAIVVTPTKQGDRPVFRIRVDEVAGGKPWDHWSNVPSYIRPYWRLDHYEFLERVTPEEFRTATLYPVGVPVVPLLELLGKHLSAARRRAQEKQSREEVRAALAQVLACRANPAGPGC